MPTATRDQAPGGNDRPEPATAAERAREPAFMRLVEEDRGSPVGCRPRRLADSPDLIELTAIAIALGSPRAVRTDQTTTRPANPFSHRR